MSVKANISHVVYTNKAKCRDCNRCVRVCPVNAIKIENAQAQVISERCIDCGACVIECPQTAKSYMSDLEKVQKWLRGSKKMAISLAPSFVSAFPDWQATRVPSALRMLGADYIAETAIGAYYVAHKNREHIERNPTQSHICTSCPAVVTYVEKYAPQLTQNLIPVVSPLVAHARIIKKDRPEHKLIFVGPCIAKIREIRRPELKSIVDAAITFEEMKQLFETNNISLENCEESTFDEIPAGDSRLFPIEGGLLKTAGMSTDLIDVEHLAISGAREIQEALRLMETSEDPMVIEPLYCKHGCINGPGMPQGGNSFQSRKGVLKYNKNESIVAEHKQPDWLNLGTYFRKESIEDKTVFTDAEIQAILNQTGKENPENELDCGACGYNTCRDKAIAVMQGIAEVEMCMPYMRRLAEQRSDLIIESAPSGMVVLDYQLRIKMMNASFKKMFVCSDKLLEKEISYLIDANPFEKLLASENTVYEEEVKIPNYNLVCHQICYKIPEEKKIVGVFVDVTDMRKNHRKLNDIKTETIIQANELIEHQVTMAQDLARFLGENTARGEQMLNKLIDAIDK